MAHAMKLARTRTVLMLVLALGLWWPAPAAGQAHRPPVLPAAPAALALDLRRPGLRPSAEELAPGLAALRQGSGAGGWLLIAGGAVAGGVVGFSIAAPDCLDGSRGCGSKPLVYTAIGAAVGAGVGALLQRLLR